MFIEYQTFQALLRCIPPSTGIMVPVSDGFSARKTAVLTISFTPTGWCMGTFSNITVMPLVAQSTGGSTGPGAMAFIRCAGAADPG